MTIVAKLFALTRLRIIVVCNKKINNSVKLLQLVLYYQRRRKFGFPGVLRAPSARARANSSPSAPSPSERLSSITVLSFQPLHEPIYTRERRRRIDMRTSTPTFLSAIQRASANFAKLSLTWRSCKPRPSAVKRLSRGIA